MMEFDGTWMFFFKFGFCMLDFHGFSESWILDFESWIRGFGILDFCRSLIWDFLILEFGYMTSMVPALCELHMGGILHV